MPKVTEIYAFVSEDQGPEDEGIVAWRFGATWMPLVAADPARVKSLKPLAREISERTGKTVKLLRFRLREEVPWW